MIAYCAREGQIETVGPVAAFLHNARRSLETFYYYEKRTIVEAMRHHRVTLVCRDAGSPIAYGHLDDADGVIWLGIAVAEGYEGKGYGAQIMRALLEYADSCVIPCVSLFVDNANQRARKLFKRFGFDEDLATPVGPTITQQGANGALLIRMSRRLPVADTIGSLVDKLATINNKLFVSQDLLYEIRRMDFEAFRAKFTATEEGARELFAMLQRTCDLNFQRSQLIAEVDKRIIEIAQAAAAGKELDDGANIQRPHKTY